MASNPWEILNSSRLNVPGLIQAADQGKQQRLQELMLNRQMAREDKQSQREDATAARQDKARSLVASGAKPEEVMGQDLEIGKSYAEYRKTATAEDVAQHERQANATIQAADYMKTLPKGLARTMQWQQMKPQFAALGVAPDALDKVDPNDDTQLDNYAAQNRMFLKAKEDYTLDGERFSGITNKVVASSSKPRYQEFDPTHTYVPTNDAARNLTAPGGQTQPAQAGSFQSILAAEGGTNPDGSFRTSPAGAVGPAQVMPGTGPEAAQLAGLPWDEQRYRSDAQYNQALGQAYHAKQLSDFGDPALAAAAYNAGPGRVRQALEQGGPQGWINHVPAETQAYVQKVMGSNARGGDQTAAAGLPAGTIMGHPKDDSTPLDANSIDYVAQQYAATGQMPPLGMGKQAAAMRAQIIGRAAQLAQQQGITGADAAGIHADFKANSAALTSLNRMSSQVLAFENTALRNGALALRTGAKVGNDNITVFNKWINAGRKATGDPDVAAFDAATQTFANEYAKVVSGATGGAVTSDSARAHANDLINSAMGPNQYIKVMQTLSADMANRKRGIEDQRSSLQSLLRGGKGEASSRRSPPASSGPPPGGKPIGTYQGKAVYQMPNGDRVVEQ